MNHCFTDTPRGKRADVDVMIKAMNKAQAELQASTGGGGANSTCAIIKRLHLCGIVRESGACARSCTPWPGGCTEVPEWEDEKNIRTCRGIEQLEQCSLARPDNVGSGWLGTDRMPPNAAGLTPYDGCCQCGGGVYPVPGAPSAA